MVDNEPWFVAMDICTAIGILNAAHAVKRLHSDDVTTNYSVVDSLGRRNETNIVNESGMYRLIFQSRKPAAKEFQRWITNEVIPALRKTGGYVVPGSGGIYLPPGEELPAALHQLADAIKQKDEAVLRAVGAESLVKELLPIEAEWRTYMNSDGLCTLAELAQALGTGRQRLIDLLRDRGIFVSKEGSQGGTRPFQPYVERGWFEVKMVKIATGQRVAETRVTPKGVSEVLKVIVKYGTGEYRWDKALPTQEELFGSVTFRELEA